MANEVVIQAGPDGVLRFAFDAYDPDGDDLQLVEVAVVRVNGEPADEPDPDWLQYTENEQALPDGQNRLRVEFAIPSGALSFGAYQIRLIVKDDGGLRAPYLFTLRVGDVISIEARVLGDLGDVTIASPTDGQVLAYDAASETWVNVDIQTGPPQWEEITGKPSAFPPAPHEHAIADLPVADDGESNPAELARSDDSRLSDPREPTTHAPSHASGSTDPLTPADIGAIPASAKGQPSGVAPLDAGGLLPTSHLPPLSISDVYVVADLAERDALTVQEGDVAIVQDAGNGQSATYIWDGGSPGEWLELATAGEVTSVNGQTGSVVLVAADVGAAPEGHAHDDRYYTESEVDQEINSIQASIGTQETVTIIGNTSDGTQTKIGQLILSGRGAYHTRAEVFAEGAGEDSAAWTALLFARRAEVVSAGDKVLLYQETSLSGTDIAFALSASGDALEVLVTGLASTQIKWRVVLISQFFSTLALVDNFTDTDRTVISAHAPDVNPTGAPWVLLTDDEGIILNNYARKASALASPAYTIDVGAASYVATFEFQLQDGSQVEALLRRSADISLKEHYKVSYSEADDSVVLDEIDDQSAVFERASATQVLDAEVPYEAMVVISGSEIAVSLGGTELFTWNGELINTDVPFFGFSITGDQSRIDTIEVIP